MNSTSIGIVLSLVSSRSGTPSPSRSDPPRPASLEHSQPVTRLVALIGHEVEYVLYRPLNDQRTIGFVRAEPWLLREGSVAAQRSQRVLTHGTTDASCNSVPTREGAGASRSRVCGVAPPTVNMIATAARGVRALTWASGGPALLARRLYSQREIGMLRDGAGLDSGACRVSPSRLTMTVPRWVDDRDDVPALLVRHVPAVLAARRSAKIGSAAIY